jgi:hypothetical protein
MMADVEVLLATARADLDCLNCGSTQSHLLSLYYNVTKEELHVVKQCTCEIVDDGSPYREEFDVGVIAR